LQLRQFEVRDRDVVEVQGVDCCQMTGSPGV
jgi:hypothetical protein